MEIATRPRTRRWQRLSSRLLLVASALALCLLLPASLGLTHHVVTDEAMGGSLSRGALTFERAVTAADELRAGDVITFRPPGGEADAYVTRRIVAIDGAGLTTRGDASDGADPWRLDADVVEAGRTVFAVPLVGWPELVVPWLTWPAMVLLLALAALTTHVVSRREALHDHFVPARAADGGTSLVA